MHPLARRLKLSLLPSGAAPYRIPFGLFKGLHVILDLAHQSQVFLGLWEREIRLPVRRLLQGARHAIDVGACHGEFTLLFLSQPYLQTITAVEPWAPHLARFHDNLRLNDRSHDPRLTLRTERLGCQPAPNTIPLDHLIPKDNGPVLVKIDVDGAELDILRSAPRLLARPGTRLIVETHSEQLETDCLHLLARSGYNCRVIRNAWWRCCLPEDRPVGHNRWLSARK